MVKIIRVMVIVVAMFIMTTASMYTQESTIIQKNDEFDQDSNELVTQSDPSTTGKGVKAPKGSEINKINASSLLNYPVPKGDAVYMGFQQKLIDLAQDGIEKEISITPPAPIYIPDNGYLYIPKGINVQLGGNAKIYLGNNTTLYVNGTLYAEYPDKVIKARDKTIKNALYIADPLTKGTTARREMARLDGGVLDYSEIDDYILSESAFSYVSSTNGVDKIYVNTKKYDIDVKRDLGIVFWDNNGVSYQLIIEDNRTTEELTTTLITLFSPLIGTDDTIVRADLYSYDTSAFNADILENQSNTDIKSTSIDLDWRFNSSLSTQIIDEAIQVSRISEKGKPILDFQGITSDSFIANYGDEYQLVTKEKNNKMHVEISEGGFARDYKGIKVAKYTAKKESGVNQYTISTSKFSEEILIVIDQIFPANGVLQKKGGNTFIEFDLMLNKDEHLNDNYLVQTMLLGNSVITEEDVLTYIESPTVRGSKARNKIDITQNAKVSHYKDGIVYLHVYYLDSKYVSRYGLKIDLNTGTVSNYEFFINKKLGDKTAVETVESVITVTESIIDLKPPVIVIDQASQMKVDIANGVILEYIGPNGFDVPMRIDIPSSVEGSEIKKVSDYAFAQLGTDYLEFDSMIVTIPTTVTALGDAVFQVSNITELTIPSSITIIPNALANHAGQLKVVNLPNTITSIGDDAFNGCRNLTGINIPNTVTSIGARAFEGCSELKDLYIPASVKTIGTNAFLGVPAIDKLSNNGFLIVNNILMLYTGTEKNVVIPEGVTSISNSAFGTEYIEYGFWGKASRDKSPSQISSVTLPSSLKSIGDYAFAGIETLEKVTFNDGLESIGKASFYDCKNLKTIDLPTKLVSIGHYAFGSTGLTKLTTPNNLKSIGDYAFAYNQITSVTLSDSISHVGAYAFHVERDKAKIVFGHEAEYCEVNAIPKNLLSVGEYAFKDCSFSKSFVIPASLTDIKTAFAYTKINQKVTIPGRYKEIPDKAFEYAEFKDLIIESGITKIGDQSFAYCKLLETALLPNTLVSIGDKAFAACYNLKVKIPDSVIIMPGSAFYESKIIK